jgi:uncharacterized RDD family membrane protein YckC
MTDSTMVGGREPRHFWRRGFAFLLDALVAQLIAALLFTLIYAVSGISLGQGLIATYQTDCAAAPDNHPQVTRVRALWPLPGGARRESFVCDHAGTVVESKTFITRVIRTEGSTTYTKEAVYPIDKDGNALPIQYELDLTSFAIMAFFVILAANGRRTPGKAAMSLRIKTTEGGTPGWGHAIRREVLKLLPVAWFGLLTLWMAVAPPAAHSDSEAMIIGMRDGTLLTSPWMLALFIWSAISAVWWYAPFIFWRGRTWYDALAGTKLVRTERPVLSGPRRP